MQPVFEISKQDREFFDKTFNTENYSDLRRMTVRSFKCFLKRVFKVVGFRKEEIYPADGLIIEFKGKYEGRYNDGKPVFGGFLRSERFWIPQRIEIYLDEFRGSEDCICEMELFHTIAHEIFHYLTWMSGYNNSSWANKTEEFYDTCRALGIRIPKTEREAKKELLAKGFSQLTENEVRKYRKRGSSLIEERGARLFADYLMDVVLGEQKLPKKTEAREAALA